jgi:putative sigma-54 modulation protein
VKSFESPVENGLYSDTKYGIVRRVILSKDFKCLIKPQNRLRMKLQVHSIHFDADQKLLGFIQQKLNKLDTFFDRITSGEVYLRLGKGDSMKVMLKTVEIKINVPGSSLFVKEEGRTFEEAIDIALEALKAQLKKHKEKQQIKHAAKPQMVEADED